MTVKITHTCKRKGKIILKMNATRLDKSVAVDATLQYGALNFTLAERDDKLLQLSVVPLDGKPMKTVASDLVNVLSVFKYIEEKFDYVPVI